MRLTFLFMPVDSWSYWECYGRRWKQSETKRSLLISVDTVSFFFSDFISVPCSSYEIVIKFFIGQRRIPLPPSSIFLTVLTQRA